MTRTSILSATLLALALPFAAAAQTWTPGENFLQNWDYDEDGTVTVAEVLERRTTLFESFDANEDGLLSPEELADHNAMRDAMQDAQDRPDWAGQGRWVDPQTGQTGSWGFGQGRGRQGGRGGGPGQMMPGQPMPGWGYGAPQPGWGYGAPQPGWGPQGGRGPGFGYGGPMGPQPGWGQPQGFAAPGQGYAQPGAGQQAFEAQMQAGLDSNGDGQISRDEFIAIGEQWLLRFDRTRDGAVTIEDFGQGNRWR